MSAVAGPTVGEAALPGCCLCGGRAWRRLGATVLHRCGGCGTVYNARSSSRAAEEAHYAHYSEAPPAGDEHVARAQWSWLQTLAPEGSFRSVLDIGCGYGTFLETARSAGARVAGVELDPTGAAACRGKGLEVRQGSLFDVGAPEGPWSLVTLWDVLEHLEDPVGALRLLQAVTAPGGMVVVRGRNAALHVPLKVGYRRLRPVLSGLRVPDLSCVHRWGFDAAGYRRLLEQAGFHDVRLYPGIPTPGDRFSSMGRLAAAVKGGIKGLGLGLHTASGGRLYPFPSVLLSARKK